MISYISIFIYIYNKNYIFPLIGKNLRKNNLYLKIKEIHYFSISDIDFIL